MLGTMRSYITFGMTMVTLYLEVKGRVLDEANGVFLTKLVEGALGVGPEGGIGVTS